MLEDVGDSFYLRGLCCLVDFRGLPPRSNRLSAWAGIMVYYYKLYPQPVREFSAPMVCQTQSHPTKGSNNS